MTKYNVHIFREMCLKFADVEADSILEAIRKVKDLPVEDETCVAITDCDGVFHGALVDVVGDDEYTETESFVEDDDGNLVEGEH